MGVCKVQIFWEGHKFCEISTVVLSYVVKVKSSEEILQDFVAFSEYMNFNVVGMICPPGWDVVNCKDLG